MKWIWMVFALSYVLASFFGANKNEAATMADFYWAMAGVFLALAGTASLRAALDARKDGVS